MNEEAFSSRITRKIIIFSPNGSRTHDLPEYQLDTLNHSDILSIVDMAGHVSDIRTLVYDFALHDSSIAQWLECATVIPN